MNTDQLQAILDAVPSHEEKPRCVDCALHGARLTEEARARYQPPLGTVFMIPAASGGKVPICPHCSKVTTPDGDRTLVQLGITNRKRLRQEIFRNGLKVNA